MSEYQILIELTALVILGTAAQWLSWRVKIPSIILLLVFGFLAGPVSGLIKPDEIFGELLIPIISIAVAVILFEGGLNLQIRELKGLGKPVRNLIIFGALITWFISSLSAHYILGFYPEISILLGAILVVTGPTVIMPIIRSIKPTPALSSVLKWEGVIIDPLGAVLAVLVFEAVFASTPLRATFGIVQAISIGLILGFAGGLILIYLLSKRLLPDFLQNPATLAVLFIFFIASNMLQADSGLLTATIMGMVLANQKLVRVREIAEFKENLQVLLISTVFILLSARMNIADISYISLATLGFTLILILFARPIAVFVSTWRSKLSIRERIFLSSISPRGIVAAAVASIFAIRLEELGFPQAEYLVPITFFVIIVTVVFSSISANVLSRFLGVANPNPQGILIIGAHDWARDIARAISKFGIRVFLVDSNHKKVYRAKEEGLKARVCNILSEPALERLDFTGIGRMLALTPNDEINALASIRLSPFFGSTEVYQLSPGELAKKPQDSLGEDIRAHYLWGYGVTYRHLNELFRKGATIHTTKLTEEFTYEDFQKKHHGSQILLFIINERGQLRVVTADESPSPPPGSTLISIMENRESE